MRNPPILIVDDDDVAAEAEAAQSRRHASEIVRNHLEVHASLNPGHGSDYVTWLATLHPENADITIDQRFFVPGNPWWTIYEDTKYHGGNIPLFSTATAVPVDTSDSNKNSDGNRNPLKQEDIVRGNKIKNNDGRGPPFYLVCSPLTMITGFSVGFSAVLGTFLCELIALVVCHYPAALLYKSALTCTPPGALTLIPHSLCMLLYSVLALTDSILLLTSVFIVELMAIVGYLVQLLTGGVIMAKYWHQYTRRSCHGIRIIFRQCSTQKEPTRHFIFSCFTSSNQQQETMDEQNVIDVETAAVLATSAVDVDCFLPSDSIDTNVVFVEHVKE